MFVSDNITTTGNYGTQSGRFAVHMHHLLSLHTQMHECLLKFKIHCCVYLFIPHKLTVTTADLHRLNPQEQLYTNSKHTQEQ